MYTMDSKLGDLLKADGVEAFFAKAAPQMVSGPAKDFVSGMTLTQLAGMSDGIEPLLKAVLGIANGEKVDFTPVDPRTQKPGLQSGPFGAVYEIDDVDGKIYMLEHSFSGCVVVQFTKKVNEAIPGRVTYQGKPCTWHLKSIAAAHGMQMLGIFVRDFATEYDTEYVLHLEGFTDEDGNVMDPADVPFRTAPKGTADPKYAAHDAIARRAAAEGIVLLKNTDHALPLSAEAHIALVGAEDFRVEAVGAGKINPRYIVRLGEAVKDSSFIVDPDADTVLVVISRASGENYDNGPFEGQYYLTEEEKQKISDLEAADKKIVAIINSGYPMDVRWTKDSHVAAAIWAGYPGMLGGPALVDILNGTVNPSGHLTDTWADDYHDIPSSKNFYVPESADKALDADHDVWIDTVYEEDIYVGYRYFETFGKPVAYPFGLGLSYTTFDLTGELEQKTALRKSADTSETVGNGLSEGDFITNADGSDRGAHSSSDTDTFYGNDLFTNVNVTITNTGSCAGREVAQVYVRIPDGKLEQPSLRLAAFHKTKLLAPGESEAFALKIPEHRLASFDEETSSYIMEAGTYEFYVGTSVKDVISVGSITVSAAKVLRKVGDYMKPPIDFARLSKKDPEGTYPTGKLSGIVPDVHELQHKSSRAHIANREVLNDPDVDSWSKEELVRFSVCASAGWGMQDVGVAGRVAKLEGRNIPDYAVADGNNGVNINKKNIGMPTSSLVCSTWDPDLSYEVGKVIAEEAKENHVNMILAPAMNIHRNPLNGRQPEYFSEDPLLAGIMAGEQSKGLENNGVSSSVKHVCCNNAEASRKRNHSIVSQRALREIYLRAFEEALRIHEPDSIMTAYNACNGCFTAADEELLQGIFRGEFGFEGFVMTDWNSYDTADVAAAVEAGNCWLTPGTKDDKYTAPILKGLEDGTIDESRLRQNVKYMHRVIMKATE